MDIEIEDVAFIFTIFGLFALFLYMRVVLDSIIPSLLVIWIGVTLAIIVHTIIYLKKKRDIRTEKIRYAFTIVPMYILLSYATYKEIIYNDLSKFDSMLISGFVLVILFLSGIVETFLKKKVK
jgi:hypothetical protein